MTVDAGREHLIDLAAPDWADEADVRRTHGTSSRRTYATDLKGSARHFPARPAGWLGES